MVWMVWMVSLANTFSNGLIDCLLCVGVVLLSLFPDVFLLMMLVLAPTQLAVINVGLGKFSVFISHSNCGFPNLL